MATTAPERPRPATARPAAPAGSHDPSAAFVLVMAGVAARGTLNATTFAETAAEHDVRSARLVGHMRHAFHQAHSLSQFTF